uniref:TPR_MLP1_2 domain-containing protein n=1 Tax=Macrostomum lignano TaxID=282301 RepID=A0A1I8HGB3_9PLAT
EQQLEPLARPFNASSYSAAPAANSAADSSSDERVRSLETRLGLAERSNRGLLDEVLRLQTEVRAVSRRGEEAIREERQARQYLEASLRTSSDLTSQLAQRIRAQEERLADERAALADVVNQTRSVEQLTLERQQDLTAKRESQISRIATLERDLESMTRAKGQLERVAFQLVEEMRALKQRLEAQGLDFSTVTSDLKVKSRRLEDDYNLRLESVQRKLEKTSELDQQSQQLRGLVDAKITELRDALTELRSRSETESDERRNLEQKLGSRLTQMNSALAEQARKRDEALHGMEQRQRERERQAEVDRATLQARLQDSLEEVNQKILEKEIRLREEAARRQAESEKMILQEQESRLAYEKEARQEQERRWDTLRRAHEEELASLRATHKSDRAKTVESVRKIDDAVVILEKQLEETRKDMSRVLGAEIASRKAKDKDTKDRMHEVEEKISAATAALQQAVAGVSTQMRSLSEANKKHMQEMLEEYRKENGRKLADIEAQLESLRQRLAGVDDRVESKLAAATTAMTQNLREKVESISLWQTQTNAQVAEMKAMHKTIDEGVNRNTERINLLKEDTRANIGAEVSGRVQDVDSLRKEIDIVRSLIPKDEGITKRDLEECQASIRRLAEITQTVKTVLGMKIQSEQKLRVEEVKNVQNDIAQLRAIIEPLIERMIEPRMFVKPDDWKVQGRDAVESVADDVNTWSIYSAYRWMYFKEKWMYLKWQASSRNHPGDQSATPGPSNGVQ